MAAQSCGAVYRCCVGLDIPELKKYQDQTWGHLDGRNPTARCSIYNHRPACCRDYFCLWREGHFNDEDCRDKSGATAHSSLLESRRPSNWT